jgi:uncharacterized protein YkwD
MIWRAKKAGARRLVVAMAMLGVFCSTLGCYITALPTVDRIGVLTGSPGTQTLSPTNRAPVSTQTSVATSTAAPSPMPTLVSPMATPVVAPSLTAEETVLPQPTATLPEGGVEAWPHEVFRLINVLRVEHDLAPFTYSKELARVAQLHGQDCLERGSLTHSGSDGSTVKTRILRSGYDAVGWAEVIVYSASPQEAINWWMDEVPPNDPHRSTLLGSWVTEIGVAVLPLGNGYCYFIADLARPAK